MLVAGSVNSDWYLGLTLGFVIVTVVVIVVAVILSYASRIADQARLANEVLEDVRLRTESLAAVRTTNASGLAILAAARSAREAVVTKVTGVVPATSSPLPPPAPRTDPPEAMGPESYPSGGRFSRDDAPSGDVPEPIQPESDPSRGGRR